MTISRSVRLRIVALVVLCIGAAGFGLAIMIEGWPQAAGDPTSYLMPGGNGSVKADIIPLLSQIGGALIGAALAILLVAQMLKRRDERMIATGETATATERMHPLKRIAMASVTVLVILGATLGYQWHNYVTAGASPYDEVGISINSALPRPLRVWGCAQIEARFRGALPPLGCGNKTGNGWISDDAQ
jgi:hypothetical protein